MEIPYLTASICKTSHSGTNLAFCHNFPRHGNFGQVIYDFVCDLIMGLVHVQINNKHQLQYKPHHQPPHFQALSRWGRGGCYLIDKLSLKKVRAKVRISPQIETSASESAGQFSTGGGKFLKNPFCFATNWKGAETKKWADLLFRV